MKYALHTGCVSKGACRELLSTTKGVLEELEFDFEELKTSACTGAGVIHEVNPEVGDTINARTLAIAESMGTDLLTICSTCQGVLHKVNKNLKSDHDHLTHVNYTLSDWGYEYKGSIEVKHLLWALNSDYGLDRLKSKVKNPLTGLKVAAFYGCYLLRPSEYMDFDDAENPTSMENVIRALGAEPVMYDGRTKCCGFPIMMMNKKNSLTMTGKHLLDAKENGADCIVTPCPLCHLNLDASQPEAESLMEKKIALPVLHIGQLIGLAIGVDVDTLGLKKHIVSTGDAVFKALK